MSKTEQQLADELDAFLTAKLAGQQPPASDEKLATETKLAANLIELAQATTPDPQFQAVLERKLARSAGLSAEQAASRRSQPKKTELLGQRMSWQEITLSIRRLLTMKRTLYTLGAVGAIALIAIFVWTTFLNDGGDDVSIADVSTPVVEATTDAGDTPVEESPAAGEPSTGDTGTPDDAIATPTGPAELALLPRMQENQGGGGLGGGIGGGGGEAESVAAEVPVDAESRLYVGPDFTQIFSATNFVLNTTLPIEPAQATVLFKTYRQEQIEVDEARQIADQFGFTGPLYVEVWDIRPEPLPAVEPLPETGEGGSGVSEERPTKEEPAVYVPPKVYRAFEGDHILTIYPDGVSYITRYVNIDYNAPVPNATQIAESFLLERGWLDFPYELRQGFSSGEVQVHRIVDGVILEDPELFVQVAPEGGVVYANNSQLFVSIQSLGAYPLISAEAAWQLVQDDVVGNNIFFNVIPDFDRLSQPVFEPPADAPQFWPHTYQPGVEVHLYMWPTVFQRADGDGPPRIEMGNYILSGSDDDLQAIADQLGQLLHVWGQIGADNLTFELSGWDAVPQTETISQVGTIQREADQVLFSNEQGETYVVQDIPAEVTDGLKVNLFAWGSHDAGMAYPVLDWEWVETYREMEEMPLPEPAVIGEEGIFDPYDFSEITINEVKLIYFQMYDFESFAGQIGQPPAFVQPAWQFKGVADNGSQIEFRVQAVAPEYLQSQ